MKQVEEAKLTVRAVERALDLLLCFTEETELGLMELAVRTGLHKSTVHRLLATLESKGFVKRNPTTDKYRLGFRVWELSAHLTQNSDPERVLLPELEHLRDVVGETVSLYVRDGLERVRIQAVQSNQPVRRVAPVGARMPLYVGASSKVLVAFADPEIRQQVLDPARWPEGLDREGFRRQLEEVRQKGYAISVEEREVGAAAVSVPIFNSAGELAYALAVSGPSNRLTVERMIDLIPTLKQFAEQMGKMVR